MLRTASRIKRAIFNWLSQWSFRIPGKITYTPHGRPRVLVLGVYLADRRNTVPHLIDEFSRSRYCEVAQYWVALNGPPPTPEVATLTCARFDERIPKFILLNRILKNVDVNGYDFVVVCDDDILLKKNFVDAFIGWQQQLGFGLAQPARTWNSYIDHAFVRKRSGLKARETRFVEIGPIFSMSQAMARLLLPFDENSPMGWGYDFVWPVVAGNAGLPIGIIDDLPVDHSLRARSETYSYREELTIMSQYLQNSHHLRGTEAFTVIRKFR